MIKIIKKYKFAKHIFLAVSLDSRTEKTFYLFDKQDFKKNTGTPLFEWLKLFYFFKKLSCKKVKKG
ncbi:hypothetical protein GCM10022258_19630 [Aquimarina gracilis]